jgi:hypothetical protein
VISNLRRHLRVHRPSHVRRRLTCQERREYVERLIQKSGGYIDENNVYFNTFSSMCYSTSDSSSNSSSPASSPKLSLHAMETSSYRLLKPKETRPLCLTVQHLLN